MAIFYVNLFSFCRPAYENSALTSQGILTTSPINLTHQNPAWIILRWIFRKWVVTARAGSSWLRIRTGGGHL
jgi:hypothetical protein